MVLIHLIQDVAPSLAHFTPWSAGDGWLWHVNVDWGILAQQFDTDVFAGFRNAWNYFIKSGQVWALIIGIVLGYLIRGLTTYG